MLCRLRPLTHCAVLCCAVLVAAGIMVFRNKSQAFVDDWIKVIEADETVWDQNAFNELVRKGQQFMPDDPNHYFKGKRAHPGFMCSSRVLFDINFTSQHLSLLWGCRLIQSSGCNAGCVFVLLCCR